MSNKDTIQYLITFSKNQERVINDLGKSVESMNTIAGNITLLHASIRLLLWKMEVLTNPVLLKDICDLSHDEWMALTPEQVVELVEAIQDVPEQK